MTREWLATLVLVVMFAFGVEWVGSRAYRRIAGTNGIDQELHARLESTENVPAPATSSRFPRSERSSIVERCEEGFVPGAVRAFTEADGSTFIDLGALRDIAGSAIDVAPEMIAAAPAALGAMANDWDIRDLPQLGMELFDVLVVDSFRTTQRMAIRAWNGSGVLLSAGQAGDCVAFGQTLRSGVNNLPEATLAFLDVVSMTSGAAKLGKGSAIAAIRRARAVALAKRALSGTKQLARNIVRRSATVWTATETAFRTVTHAAVEEAARAAREVTEASARRWAGLAHASPDDVGRFLSRGSDDPLWGAPFVGAARSVNAIYKRWPELSRLPSAYRVALWDLAQARLGTVDRALDRFENMLRARQAMRVVGRTLWSAHGEFLPWHEARSVARQLLLVRRGRRTDLVTELTDPPAEFLVSRRIGWKIRLTPAKRSQRGSEAIGRDLRTMEPEAYEMLTESLPRVVQDGRRLSIGVARLETTAEPLGGILERQAAVYRESTLAPVDEARRRFHEAELSARIARAVSARQHDSVVDPEMLKLAANQPIAIHTLGGPAWGLVPTPYSKALLNGSFLSQAAAENAITHVERNFLTDLAARGVHIEVFGFRSLQANDVDLLVPYLTWFDAEGRKLYFVQYDVAARGLHLPNGIPYPNRAPVLSSLPVPEDESAIYEFQRIVNTWRRDLEPSE